jgi:hypothetical protein
MLEIKLLSETDSSPEISIRAPSLRVCGGTICIGMNSNREIAYTRGVWRYRGRDYRKLTVNGSLYLIFGIAREPTIVSHPFDHFYFIGPIISTNGVPIAKYSEYQNTWHGLLRRMWWVSLRIVTSDCVNERDVSTFKTYEERPERPSRSRPHRLTLVGGTAFKPERKATVVFFPCAHIKRGAFSTAARGVRFQRPQLE